MLRLRALNINFTTEHKEDFQKSGRLYNAILIGALSIGFVLRMDPLVLLNLTVAALVVAHAARIYQIANAKPIGLDGAQVAYCMVVAALISLPVTAAYFFAARPIDPDLRTYFGIFLSLFLAQMFSYWVDFFVAYFFNRKTSIAAAESTASEPYMLPAMPGVFERSGGLSANAGSRRPLPVPVIIILVFLTMSAIFFGLAFFINHAFNQAKAKSPAGLWCKERGAEVRSSGRKFYCRDEVGNRTFDAPTWNTPAKDQQPSK